MVIGLEINIGSMSGLNCSSIEVLKCLEGVENLEYLEIGEWGNLMGNASVILDLRNTNLKKIYIRRNYSKYLLSI